MTATASTSAVARYGRVLVSPGKHGQGDYRVTFGGSAPTHGELLVMLWWIFEAEDRYPSFGRRMLWWNIGRVYGKDAPLAEVVRDVDGTETANSRGAGATI